MHHEMAEALDVRGRVGSSPEHWKGRMLARSSLAQSRLRLSAARPPRYLETAARSAVVRAERTLEPPEVGLLLPWVISCQPSW